mmetsp:Transcript_20520/g.41727  ORF Transcript_20520/g.41727 Transcript_20520/m.41727 type:complete len:215 (+) Transcript_20520:99-743(+)
MRLSMKATSPGAVALPLMLCKRSRSRACTAASAASRSMPMRTQSSALRVMSVTLAAYLRASSLRLSRMHASTKGSNPMGGTFFSLLSFSSSPHSCPSASPETRSHQNSLSDTFMSLARRCPRLCWLSTKQRRTVSLREASANTARPVAFSSSSCTSSSRSCSSVVLPMALAPSSLLCANSAAACSSPRRRRTLSCTLYASSMPRHATSWGWSSA